MPKKGAFTAGNNFAWHAVVETLHKTLWHNDCFLMRSNSVGFQMTLFLPFLSIAIGFSWSGCIAVFARQPNMSTKGLAVGTAFTSICVGAIGLSLVCAQTDLIGSAAALAAGLAIAHFTGTSIRPLLSLMISAAGLAVYIKASTS